MICIYHIWSLLVRVFTVLDIFFDNSQKSYGWILYHFNIMMFDAIIQSYVSRIYSVVFARSLVY